MIWNIIELELLIEKLIIYFMFILKVQLRLIIVLSFRNIIMLLNTYNIVLGLDQKH